jgi:hypothetical protein
MLRGLVNTSGNEKTTIWVEMAFTRGGRKQSVHRKELANKSFNVLDFCTTLEILD